MTVKELINILSKFNKDLKVVINGKDLNFVKKQKYKTSELIILSE